MVLLLGKTEIKLVKLGQTSEGIYELTGLTYEHYFKGEAVSVARTNGSRTIAIILKVCPEFISLALGNELEKQITASNVPIWIRKLVGPYYVAKSIRIVPMHQPLSEGPVSADEIPAVPLTLGQDCTGDLFRSYPGIGCQSFFIGELVSVQRHGRRQVGIVLSFGADALEVSLGVGSNPIHFTHEIVDNNVFKFLDLFYLADMEPFPSITVGRSTFQPLTFGQPCDHISRTKSFQPTDFASGEPVAIRVNSSRICGEVHAVDTNWVDVSTVEGTCYRFQVPEVLDICKPDGNFYIVERPSTSLVVAVDDEKQAVQVGRTAMRSLQLGHTVSPKEQLQTRHSRFPPRSHVSVALFPGDGVVGEVLSMSEDGQSVMVILTEGSDAIPVDIAKVTMLKGVRFIARKSSPTMTGPVTRPTPPNPQAFPHPMRTLAFDRR
jgi:hypothetical protein